MEDEVPMRKFLRAFLSGAGYRVDDAASAEAGMQLAVDKRPDLVILDLGLPDMDGQDVLRKLREWMTVPIIVLSVRYQDAQKIMALNHGADDYLTKPFSTGELLARIRVALRHAMRGQSGGELPVFESGDLSIDLATRRVFARGTEIKLTRIEYKLLTTMVRQAGKVLTHRPAGRQGADPSILARGSLGSQAQGEYAVFARVHGRIAQKDRVRPRATDSLADRARCWISVGD
jgi:two-component system KDP operon response regulator KdpE